MFKKKIINLKQRTWCIILALSLTTVLISGCSQKQDVSEIIPESGLRIEPASIKTARNGEIRKDEFLGHQLVAENQKWELFLKEETLGIVIRSKSSGEYMTGTVLEPEEKDNANWKGFYQSGVVLEYIKGTNLDYTRADFINNKNEKSFTWLTDGFTVKVTFPDIEISYELTVQLTDTGFTAEIPQSSIVEGNEEFTTGTFYIYPFLGNTYLGQDPGYMIIPDGQGIVIDLEDNEKRFNQPYRNYIYGNNWGVDKFAFNETATSPEDILIPVYGMVHTEKKLGYLAIVEWGDTSCKIEASPNGTQTNFDWISSRFIYRQVYRQPTGKTSGTIQMRTDRANKLDMKIRFEFAEGDEANYAGLAVRYREYLDERGAFDNVSDMDYRTLIDFFGLDQKDWAMFKLDVPMTTYDEAAEIITKLHENGVGKLLTIYNGWQDKGSYNVPNMSFNPSSTLGGKSGMEALLKTMSEYGDLLRISQDSILINQEVYPFEVMNAFKMVTRETFMYHGSNLMENPFRSLEIAKSAVDSYSKIDGLGLQLYGTSDFLTSFSYQSNYYDRADNAAIYYEMTKTFSDKLPITQSYAYQYLWPLTSALTDMPTGGSSYIYTSREIPFLSIVLSGKMPYYVEHMNFEANQHKFFLQMVEQGARPSFLITKEDSSELVETRSNGIYSSRYDLYEGKIIEYDQTLSALHEQIKGSSIIAHETTGNGSISKVTYDNGVKVYVNYSQAAVSTDGIEIGALDFKVVI